MNVTLLKKIAGDAEWLRLALMVSDEAVLAQVRARSGDELRAAATWLYVERGRKIWHKSRYWTNRAVRARAALAAISRRKLGWTPVEVELLWSAFDGYLASCWHSVDAGMLVRLPLAAAEQVGEAGRAAVVPSVRALLERGLDSCNGHWGSPAEQLRVERRLRALLPAVDPGALTDLPPQLLGGADAFAPAARAALLEHHEPAVLAPLLQCLHDYTGTVPPRQAWRARVSAVLSEAPARVDAVRLLLRRLCLHREARSVHEATGEEWVQYVFVVTATAQVLRAAVWALREAAGAGPLPPGDVALLGEVAVHCAASLGGSGGTPRCPQVAASAIAVLGGLDGDAGVVQLARLRTRMRNKTLLKQLAQTLDAAASRAGLTPGQLLERTVPACGLDAGGGRREVGDHVAEVVVTGAAVRLEWRTAGGRALRGVPTAVRTDHATELAELRALVKEAGATLSAERARLEQLLVVDPRWAGADWMRLYADHPLTGALARSLLWQHAGVVGLPVRNGSGWGLRALDGSVAPVAADGEVRLWHPLRVPAPEVAAWREHLTAAQVRQPFKQAFREVYLLTPAEEETATYSNRFAAHILRYRQAGALMRTRGWNTKQLGYWDGGYEGEATREFTEQGWRVTFFHDVVENADDGYGFPQYCSTDQVRFERRAPGGGWESARLVDVPALVFSEAMRDVDLFVGVTSIAGDPQWTDRGGDRFRDYWQCTTFGALTESAQVRREALARLMPRTRIADRVRLTERFLEVRGSRHTYKIHLGSGNILMSPKDAYLCIVPARWAGGRSADRVFLPFEEDGGMLSVIVSKAFLLADDASITDPTILAQL